MKLQPSHDNDRMTLRRQRAGMAGIGPRPSIPKLTLAVTWRGARCCNACICTLRTYGRLDAPTALLIGSGGGAEVSSAKADAGEGLHWTEPHHRVQALCCERCTCWVRSHHVVQALFLLAHRDQRGDRNIGCPARLTFVHRRECFSRRAASATAPRVVPGPALPTSTLLQTAGDCSATPCHPLKAPAQTRRWPPAPVPVDQQDYPVPDWCVAALQITLPVRCPRVKPPTASRQMDRNTRTSMEFCPGVLSSCGSAEGLLRHATTAWRAVLP